MEQRGVLFLAFVLIALLIMVVYYQGVQTDTNAFQQAASNVISTLQGRTSSGQFANYPTTSK